MTKITIQQGEDIVTRCVYPDEEDDAQTWDELVEPFFHALQGLGYSFRCDPINMASAIINYHDNYTEE